MAKYRGTGRIPLVFDIKAYLHYYIRMKYLFNLSHLNPVEEDKNIVYDALQIVTELLKYGKKTTNKNSAAVTYFVDTFLSSKDDYYEMDDFIAMKAVLEELQQEIEEHLANGA